jgi:hypothetical protein
VCRAARPAWYPWIVLEAWIARWQEESPLARGGLCLGCRSVLADGEVCHENVAPWADGALVRRFVTLGRGEALLDTAKTDETDGSIGLGFAGLGAAGATVAAMLAAPAVGWFLAGGALLGGAAMYREAVRRRRLRLERTWSLIELAAPADDGLPAHLPRWPGRVDAGPRVDPTAPRSPLALAREEQIRPAWVTERGDVIARFGVTAGLTVTLDDGRVVAVPAGRVRLVDRGGRTGRVAVELPHPDVLARLDAIELRDGDRVELQAELAPAGEAGASYRLAPTSTHTALGTPVLYVGVAAAT